MQGSLGEYAMGSAGRLLLPTYGAAKEVAKPVEMDKWPVKPTEKPWSRSNPLH